MAQVTVYEYVADIRVSIVIAAPSQNVAYSQIQGWSHDQWLVDGEIIGVNSVDLLDVRLVDPADVWDAAHIDARKEAAPCRKK